MRIFFPIFYGRRPDHLLYDALARMKEPELTEWQVARDKIKEELPKTK